MVWITVSFCHLISFSFLVSPSCLSCCISFNVLYQFVSWPQVSPTDVFSPWHKSRERNYQCPLGALIISLPHVFPRPPSVPIGFVPQKLGLIWWVPWECKNLGELNFHMENGLPEAQKLPNRYYHISRSQKKVRIFIRSLLGLWEASIVYQIAK